MHKKYHEKFKILDILAVTTQAHEGIETGVEPEWMEEKATVTTQAHEGIETVSVLFGCNNNAVTTQAHEGIETLLTMATKRTIASNNSSP